VLVELKLVDSLLGGSDEIIFKSLALLFRVK
jgi:hypothetical protein